MLLRYSENSIDSSFPVSFRSSLWSEWSAFLAKLGKLASYWSKHPPLSRSRQFNLYRKFLKFLANSILPYLFKWSCWLSFNCFAGSMVLVWLMIFMFRCWHILVKPLLSTSFTLLFKVPFLGTINEAWIEFVSFFREFLSSIIEFAMWYAVFSDLRSLVPTRRIICSGLIYLIVGFAWSCIQLVFAELNGLTLTRYLCLIFFFR